MRNVFVIILFLIGFSSSVFAQEISKDQIKKALPSSWKEVTIDECRLAVPERGPVISEKFWCVQGYESPTKYPQGTENFRIYSQKSGKGNLSPLYKLEYTGMGMRRYEDPLFLSQIVVTGCGSGLCLDALVYNGKLFKKALHWEGQTGNNDPRLRIVPNSKIPSPIIIQSNSAQECTDTEIYTWSNEKTTYVKSKETCWEKRGPGEEKALKLNQ